MKTFTIGWLNKCRCGNKSHAVKTARGNESALWDDDAVKCNSCGRGGVIQVCEGQARVLWETDEEMAEGKPMSTLTKEWLLKTIAELEEERDAVPGAVNEDAAKALAAMKLALASLEAKPLGYIDDEYAELLKSGHIESCSVYAEPGEGCITLFTAPPAPVSVPDELLSAMEEVLRISDRDHEAWSKAKSAIAACRAAMLQGADGI
ncbi:hypothetical protein [Enterobacter ludwigii]|uniref:hypothetical protein n=1 Tax=Enterobacter ludwigii TaxID=299767 RepID=UPI00406759A6